MVCESYGLVFGTNSFIALIMQSLLTFVVTDKRGLGLHVRQQYLIYSLLHFIIALIFFCSVSYTILNYIIKRCHKTGANGANGVSGESEATVSDDTEAVIVRMEGG